MQQWNLTSWFKFHQTRAPRSIQEPPVYEQQQFSPYDPTTEFFNGFDARLVPEIPLQQLLLDQRMREMHSRESKKFTELQKAEREAHEKQRHSQGYLTPTNAVAGIGVLVAGAIIASRLRRGATPQVTMSDGVPLPPPRNFLDRLFVRHYYEGGFAPDMTKREAALILGLREHAARSFCVCIVRHRLMNEDNMNVAFKNG